MSALLPGFADQLAARAEALAAEHAQLGAARRGDAAARAGERGRFAARVRRPHLPRGRRGLGLSILVAGVALSGAAYAAQGLWQPVIGATDYHRAPGRATASPLPPEQLALLGVLRRPQTAADRGAASRYALRFQGGDVIRTNEVRLLATLPNGSSAVLIPVAQRADGHLLDFMDPTASKRDVLCLWVSDTDGGGQSCSSIGQVASGMLTGGISSAPPRTPAQQAALNAAFARATERAKRHHRSYVRTGAVAMPLGHMTINSVGVVPDGVAYVQMGRARSAPLIPVHGNVFVTTARIVSPDDQVWFDRNHRLVPRLVARGLHGLLQWHPSKHPGLAQRALEDAQAKSRAAEQRRVDAENLEAERRFSPGAAPRPRAGTPLRR